MAGKKAKVTTAIVHIAVLSFWLAKLIWNVDLLSLWATRLNACRCSATSGIVNGGIVHTNWISLRESRLERIRTFPEAAKHPHPDLEFSVVVRRRVPQNRIA